MSVEAFNSIMTGLNEALEYTNGDKTKGRSRVREIPLGIKPVKKYSKETIKDLRLRLNLSQRSFASALGVSSKTVEAWEAGTNSPSGAASRMLGLLQQDNNLFEKYSIIARQ